MLYDSAVMRGFVGIDLGPNLCRMRPQFASSATCWKNTGRAQMLETVNLHLPSHGTRISFGIRLPPYSFEGAQTLANLHKLLILPTA